MKSYLRNILVTGGAGFIGSSLTKKLIENKENYVVVVDDFSTGSIENIPPKTENLKFIKCNVNNYNDISQVILSHHFDFIFHYAAFVGVKRTLENPVRVLQDLHGIENILQLAKNSGVKRIFYSSSSEVYGEPVEIPQNEATTPLNSRLPYAIVKNASEAFLRSYHKEFGLNYTIFRFFNTYGPNQSQDFVISKFVNLALKNEDITIYGDGSQTRTFCYIDDNIEATTKIFYENLFINEVINIGNDNEISILSLAKKIIEITKSKSKIIFVPPLKEGDMKRRLPDITKMKSILNKELISLDEGLKKYIEFIKKTK